MRKKKDPYTKFIDYLDEYQWKREFSYQDSLSLTQSIQNNFQTNYQSHYTPFHYSLETPWMQNSSHSFSQSSSQSLSTDISNINPFSTNFTKNTTYSEWKNIHITAIHKIPVIKEKEKKHLHFSIQSISDILDLLDKNPYENIYDYNIDLKAMHNIREELEQLNGMIGMESVKRSILQQMIYFIQRLHISPNVQSNDYKHTILTGPPGTGKTEMAKIIGKMYAKLGILKKNVFKKVTRNDLVAGYLGQTAIKTRKVVEECLGGVLFLDEAYSLGLDDSFSKECVDTLCEALSDHRDELMMIVAGYDRELNETFFRVNPGMVSRFMWRFEIESYKPNELMGIFEKKVKDNGWEFIDGFMENKLKKKTDWFQKNRKHFENYGRDMELLFSYVKINHAQRIFGKEESIRKKITEEDLEAGFEMFKQNKRKVDTLPPIPFGMYV
jgi:SpoVK/Ycf46/Vps4 family AAA+-type ATPase